MTPTPELLALQDLCARFDAASIGYMLTGSLALSYYARPRMTRDIDMVIELEAAQADHLIDLLGKDYHADAVAIASAMQDGRPWNIVHLPSMVKVDLIPRKDTEYRRTEFARRQRVELAGVDLWIVGIEDLILSKLEWSRASRSEQQRNDVRLLLKVPLDRAYLQQWASSLKLEAMLKEASDE